MNQSFNTFSMTGFDDKTQTQIIAELEKLGFKYEKNLSLTTKILIADSTATQKFKIAKLKKTPTPCVSKKWVEDSVAKNYPQPYDKYVIKDIFLGVSVGVCGFNEQKARKLEKIICDRGGSVVKKYSATEIIRKYEDIPEKPDVIIGTEDEIQRAQHAKIPQKDDHIVPLVRLQWLDHSLKGNRCKFPKDYAVNLLVQKPVESNKKRLQKNLSNSLENYDIMELENEYLNDTMIYIDSEIAGDFAKLLKNVIAICGGYWTDKFSSIVTHVLVTQIDEAKYKGFKKYGNRIHVVKCEWLVDSILLFNRMDEEDYLVRSFKLSDQQYRTLTLMGIARMDENSQNINSVSAFQDRRMTMNSNTFPILVEPVKRKSTQLQSNIFQNHSFYFPSDLSGDSVYSELISSIKKAGGLCYNKINSKMHVYVPLKDSPLVTTIKQKLIVQKLKATVVSERWIKECIKKNQFIEFDSRKYPHFRAFDFVTPLNEFHRFIFEVVGFPTETSPRIRELLSVFGSTKMNPNKSQVTHILCGPSWKEQTYQERIKKIQVELDRMNRKDPKKEQKTIQLIKFNWIDQCEKEKKIASTEGFIVGVLETEFPQTPEKKVEDSNSGSDLKNTEAENKSEIKLTP